MLDKPKRLGYSADMPTVIRQDGFRVMINTHDHEPPHAHCTKSGATVLIDIETLTVRKNYSLATNEIRNARRIVEANAAKLLAAWRKVHPR